MDAILVVLTVGEQKVKRAEEQKIKSMHDAQSRQAVWTKGLSHWSNEMLLFSSSSMSLRKPRARKRRYGVINDLQFHIELKIEVGNREVHNLWLFSLKIWTV